MTPIEDLSLAHVNSEAGTCRIAGPAGALSRAVDGVCLEAGYRLEDRATLVVLSDDSPYDEGLHIYLLDEAYAVSDGIRSRSLFTPGIFDVSGIGERTLDFAFFKTDHVYRLTVGPRKWRWSLPRGWVYCRWHLGHSLSLHVI